MSRDAEPFSGGFRVIVWSLTLAAIGLGFSILGWIVDARQMFASYLIAYFFVVTVALGLMAFLMGAHAMSAAWPATVRRLAESGLGAMPLVGALYVPLFFAPAFLYPWARPESVADPAARALLDHRVRIWLHRPMFDVRAVCYVLVWVIAALLLRRWSLAMDRPGAPDLRARLRKLSCGILPLVGIAGTFAAFDWVMALSPDFYSTMYGLYTLAGGFVAALGLLAILMYAAQRAGFLAGVRVSHWYAIGRLLFAFLIFWAYTAFFQYLLIWIANRPIEAKFYLERIQPGDRGTSWFLIFGHFAAPWLLLLSYEVKRRRATVTLLGAWLLACHYVDIHWLVGARRAPAAPWQWQDAPALMLVGGLTVAFAVWRQRGRLLSAYHDPDYAAGLAYESR
ncbi:MAG TPA: hypothetical protein VFF06_09455 [Polyangia bacterium]|nr:hypothetical protein [Polyangia bacterium]